MTSFSPTSGSVDSMDRTDELMAQVCWLSDTSDVTVYIHHSSMHLLLTLSWIRDV